MKILDCTLRDGGYYTNWTASLARINDTIKALDNAHVDIIELGYKSRNNHVGWCGRVSESRTIYNPNYAELAFMVDVKEFIGCQDELNDIILPADESIYTWARLATHYSTICDIPWFVDYFRDRGYKVSVNLMGGMLMPNYTVPFGRDHRFDDIKVSRPNIFYWADSYGQMDFDSVKDVIDSIHDVASTIGMHFHDNCGLALSNALFAQEYNHNIIIDSSLRGMGRGAGNVKTEMLVNDYEPLLDVIDYHYRPLHDKHQWGPNLAYAYCAKHSIHPSYGQDICQWPVDERSRIELLKKIPEDKRQKYDKKMCAELLKHRRAYP